MKGLRLSLVLAAGAAACQKPPPPRDPSDEAYHRAVVRFSEASSSTGDLSFRAPPFDDVVEELMAVPRGGEGFAKANALLQRIRAARHDADESDAASARARAEAVAAPTFQPLSTADLAPMPRPPAAANESRGAETRAGLPASPVVSAAGAAPPGPQALPEWYQQAGYFGLKKPPEGGEAPAAHDVADAGAPTPVAETPTPQVAPRKTRSPAEPPPEPLGPPPIFGLPGPSQRAVTNQAP